MCYAFLNRIFEFSNLQTYLTGNNPAFQIYFCWGDDRVLSSFNTEELDLKQ